MQDFGRSRTGNFASGNLAKAQQFARAALM
jgi:hypothetical protein